jgi:hypothetical protein
MLNQTVRIFRLTNTNLHSLFAVDLPRPELAAAAAETRRNHTAGTAFWKTTRYVPYFNKHQIYAYKQ